MHDLAVFYNPDHVAHFETGHPERPERVETVWNAMRAMPGFDQAQQIQATELPPEILHAVHTPAYLAALEEHSRTGRRFDSDTYVTPASFQLAQGAAGGAAALSSAVWEGQAQRGFALTRPPGHHATPNRAMGFCLMNNVALAAEHLRQVHGAQRLAIVDLDLHHGNGTQDIFWRRGDIFYLSTHQYPHYPGTGALQETGAGEGEGATANIPFPAYSGDQAFQEAMGLLILPLLDRFRPEMVLVSFGFDPHWRDPLGYLLLSAAEYGGLVGQLSSWADEKCGGRIALFLEGGYDLEAGAACTQAVVAALLGWSFQDPLGPAPWQEENGWRAVLQQAQSLWEL